MPGTQLDFDLSSYNLDICIGPQMPEKSITFPKKSITFRGLSFEKDKGFGSQCFDLTDTKDPCFTKIQNGAGTHRLENQCCI